MATINIDNVTNETESGIFDKLMKSINSNIEKQYLNNRITGSDYATVYLGSMQAALSQSIQFSLQEDLVEAQVAGVLADNALKADQLLTSAVERDIKSFELNSLLPEQLIKLQEEIDLLQTQDSEALLNGAKQRLIMDEEIETANLQQVILATEEELKTAQKDEVLDSTARANTQLADSLLTATKQRLAIDEEIESANKQQLLADEQIKTSYTDRVLKDKQAAKLGMDNVMKIAEANRTSDPNFVYHPSYAEV